MRKLRLKVLEMRNAGMTFNRIESYLAEESFE